MTFAWTDFLDLAKNIPKTTEANLRTAISRSYYALFCSARDRLKQSKIEVSSTGDSHIEVPNLYKLSTDYDSLKIAETLARLRILRNNADYDLVFNGDPAVATNAAITRAEKAIVMVHNFPERIIEEIKQKI